MRSFVVRFFCFVSIWRKYQMNTIRISFKGQVVQNLYAAWVVWVVYQACSRWLNTDTHTLAISPILTNVAIDFTSKWNFVVFHFMRTVGVFVKPDSTMLLPNLWTSHFSDLINKKFLSCYCIFGRLYRIRRWSEMES